jgi:hypothetical protein
MAELDCAAAATAMKAMLEVGVKQTLDETRASWPDEGGDIGATVGEAVLAMMLKYQLCGLPSSVVLIAATSGLAFAAADFPEEYLAQPGARDMVEAMSELLAGIMKEVMLDVFDKRRKDFLDARN